MLESLAKNKQLEDLSRQLGRYTDRRGLTGTLNEVGMDKVPVCVLNSSKTHTLNPLHSNSNHLAVRGFPDYLFACLPRSLGLVVTRPKNLLVNRKQAEQSQEHCCCH